MQRTDVNLQVTLDRPETPSTRPSGAARPSRRPQPNLSQQIGDAVRDLIASGVLAPGDRLPASRSLAQQWTVSRGTVLGAWDQLIAEGYLLARHGSGTIVNPDLASGLPPTGGRATRPAPARRRHPKPTSTAIDLRPERPDVTAVRSPDWRRAWRHASTAGAEPTDPAGQPRLRQHLAAHLRTLRGVVVDPDDLVVTTGARDGLATLLHVVARHHARPLLVAVENPGYPSLHQVPSQLGATVRPIAVDEQGLRVAELTRGAPPDVVLVTPSHQYPLGASMTISRRVDLLAWAADTGGLVVEDDYASELRYVGAPLPALAALDRARNPRGAHVVTLGSFAKTVTPELGIGFLVLPEHLRHTVIEHRAIVGPVVSAVAQRAVAEYLADGGLRRHTQRTRRNYRRRQQMVARALDLPGVAVGGLDGGLHAMISWAGTEPSTDPAAAESDVAKTLAAQGVQVGTLSAYWSRATTDQQHGLVIGYATVDDETLHRGLHIISEVLRSQGLSPSKP